MKFFIPLLLITLQACSGSSGGSRSAEKEGVIVFGDSICADNNHPIVKIKAWPGVLEELSQVNIDSLCIPGIQLSEYDFEAGFATAGTQYQYAVINLGINDIIMGKSFDVTAEKYGAALSYIESRGIEPVCFIYSSDRTGVAELGVAIEALCSQRKLMQIHSSPETFDGLHLNEIGQYDTAVDAWRVLFPDG